MRKVVFAINMTADGYCSHTSANPDEELLQYFSNLLRNADVILFGRTTYELMVPYWPEIARTQSDTPANNEFARVFDSLALVVFSRTLKEVAGNKTRIVRSDLVQEATALKQQPGKDIAVGSLSIASQLSEQGLIDEYRFVIHPVLAGNGPRMFESVQLKEKLSLALADTKVFPSGVVALHYRKQ